jgi:hypothetical protein
VLVSKKDMVDDYQRKLKDKALKVIFMIQHQYNIRAVAIHPFDENKFISIYLV